MAVKKKYGTLGRGLDSLISTEDVRPELSSTINEIEISLIDANPNQPRREFDSDALQELAESIAEIGIIQPITLRHRLLQVSVVGVLRSWHIFPQSLPIFVRQTMRM